MFTFVYYCPNSLRNIGILYCVRDERTIEGVILGPDPEECKVRGKESSDANHDLASGLL